MNLCPLPATSTDYTKKSTPQGTELGDDYTPNLLGHARLYVLADKYDIESLKALVLHKLHDTLQIFVVRSSLWGCG